MLIDAARQCERDQPSRRHALHWAAMTGDATVAELLLDAGADPILPATSLDGSRAGRRTHYGYSALARRLTGLAAA